MSGVPEGPIIREVEAEDYFSVTEKGIKDGSFKEAAKTGFRVLQDFCENNNLLGKHVKVIGVSPDDPIKKDTAECRYISCMKFDRDDMKTLEPKDKVKRYQTEKGLYAVFIHKGPHDNIQKAYQWIVEKYMPQAAYVYRTGSAPYECYLNDPANTTADLLETEIYIPVDPKPKQKIERKEGKEESKEGSFEETKEALVEETKEAVVEETKDAVLEETKEAVIEETKEDVIEATKETTNEEIKEAVNEEIKNTVDEKAVNEEIKEAVNDEIKEAVDEEKKEAIVEEKKE